MSRAQSKSLNDGAWVRQCFTGFREDLEALMGGHPSLLAKPPASSRGAEPPRAVQEGHATDGESEMSGSDGLPTPVGDFEHLPIVCKRVQFVQTLQQDPKRDWIRHVFNGKEP